MLVLLSSRTIKGERLRRAEVRTYHIISRVQDRITDTDTIPISKGAKNDTRPRVDSR